MKALQQRTWNAERRRLQADLDARLDELFLECPTLCGFTLNPATDLKLATLFPQHAPSEKVADPVYFGGPEMADSIFAVARRDPGGQAMELFGELYVTASAEAIDRIIEQTPNDARYFA